jgi:hypothetical protein
VRVEWPNGRIEVEHLRHNRGSVGNPLSAEEVCEKFRGCAARLTGDDEAERLLESLRSLGGSESLDGYANALANVAASAIAAPAETT